MSPVIAAALPPDRGQTGDRVFPQVRGLIGSGGGPRLVPGCPRWGFGTGDRCFRRSVDLFSALVPGVPGFGGRRSHTRACAKGGQAGPESRLGGVERDRDDSALWGFLKITRRAADTRPWSRRRSRLSGQMGAVCSQLPGTEQDPARWAAGSGAAGARRRPRFSSTGSRGARADWGLPASRGRGRDIRKPRRRGFSFRGRNGKPGDVSAGFWVFTPGFRVLPP